jgi:hypothetical protein
MKHQCPQAEILEASRHGDSLALLRQRIYQIVAGNEDANDSNRLR